jgi:ABC-2 type transport system permease protein
MAWGGDDWRIGFVDLSHSSKSASFTESLINSRSQITPYFKIVESDLMRGRDAVRAGTIQMLVVIPADFEKTKQVNIETFNINSDAMKNVRLRIENVVIENLNKSGELVVAPDLTKDYPGELWRSAYIGGSCVLLALFLGALMLGANLFAFDYENRTRKEISLSPLHPSVFAFGIIFTSSIVSLVLSIPALLLAVYLFRMTVHVPNLTIVYIAIIPVLVACSSLGMLLAKLCKSYRIIQPIIILSSVATFCGAGGFVAVNMLPPAARTFAGVWLASNIFEWFNPVLHNFSSGFSVSQYVMIAVVGLAGILLASLIPWNREQIRGGM